jgi:hypothetical protein
VIKYTEIMEQTNDSKKYSKAEADAERTLSTAAKTK